MAMNPWQVETNPLRLRRFGKLGEELGELQAVVSRCVIQGIDAVDPSSGKTNRQRLMAEMADVYAQMHCVMNDLQLDNALVSTRMAVKVEQMQEWEQVLRRDAKTPDDFPDDYEV